MSPSAPLILLIGMHRSGTSLLGSLLPALGLPLPGPLISGDRHNPDGYFERLDITTLQEDLLIALGRWWPSEAGALPLPPGWLDHPATQLCAARLETLLRLEQQRQAGPWAIKDPRSSLLLPLWRLVASRLQLPLQLVLSVRSPEEVVISLLRRDQEATGMTAWRAQQLWWRHNRQAVIDSVGLPLHVVHYDRWFNPQAGARQLADLAAFCGLAPTEQQLEEALSRVCPDHRRSLPVDPQSSHPAVVRFERQLRQLAEEPSSAPDRLTALRQALSVRRADQLRPAREWPLRLRTLAGRGGRWLRRRLDDGQRLSRLARGGRTRHHPWWAAALACSGQQPRAARWRLRQWLRQGLEASDLITLVNTPLESFPLGPEPAQLLPPLPERCRPVGPGLDPTDWPLQAWLQHCSLPPDFRLDLEAGEPVGFNAQAIQAGPTGLALLELTALPLVFDPDAERVRLLRRLGVRARQLRPQTEVNSWLALDPEGSQAAAQLGLPPVAGLMAAAPAELPLLVLGTAGTDWEAQLDGSLWSLPGFDALQLQGHHEARLLASWLQQARRMGLSMVRLHPRASELGFRPFSALMGADGPAGPVPWFQAPLSVDELLEELEWRRQGGPPPEEVRTPAPQHRVIWERQVSCCTATVCISLFNYADAIEDALHSVARQSHRALELIVVDDASEDGGSQLVQSWLERHGERFPRVLLLQHSQNGGLAATRNTAFAAASTPWCFVLDADNTLLPDAVANCLAVGEAAPATAAVVHPLVRRQPVGDAVLICRASWQRNLFRGGNQIDAMALVRLRAWQAVGGFQHIPGGWEDYDFYCSLMDAGFHGVLCPRVLAVYHTHSHSMTAMTTRQRQRRLSRLLERRHPWLRLPYGTSSAEATGWI